MPTRIPSPPAARRRGDRRAGRAGEAVVIANPASYVELRNGGESIGGVTVTSDAFGTVMPWFPYILTVAVMLFAISTVLTWGYYCNPDQEPVKTTV